MQCVFRWVKICRNVCSKTKCTDCAVVQCFVVILSVHCTVCTLCCSACTVCAVVQCVVVILRVLCVHCVVVCVCSRQ